MMSFLSFALILCPFFLVNFPPATSGVIHQIGGVARQMTPEHHRQRVRLRGGHARQHLLSPMDAQDATRNVTVDESTAEGNFYNEFVANITVGTPPQNVTVSFDFFYSSDFFLADSHISSSSRYQENYKLWQTYNSSASSTYVDLHKHFSIPISGSRFTSTDGYIGKDVMNVSSFSAKVAIGVVTSTWYFNGFAGTAGLHSTNSSISNATGNLITQLAPQLDQPVVTLKSNYCMDYSNPNKTIQITLGSLDEEHCQSDWLFAPTVPPRYNVGYQVNASSAVAASANGTVLAQISGQVAVYVDEAYWQEYASRSVYYLFLNASGSVWNDDSWQYEADCNSAGNVTLPLANGNLVFTPSDYLEKVPKSDVCRLSINRDTYSTGDYIELGRRFLNSHCVAYNAQSQQFGFVKVQPASS
ncbi:eukaryotic aspartyl protease domain-containing protein [Ditylenchus destructor]|uniref:Eukaryotic aspartyl protease domain-containing protein n=1 Tax=Ditylenchus destructor TaxID=166010 RepID=A0AAD4MR29_9BILA|nr:eukaryotic aspartyl protease domain-containing protein [Ditylenchus destructor]